MVHGSEMPIALCCSRSEHAVAASLQSLSKAFEGEPWGRREDGTLIRVRSKRLWGIKEAFLKLTQQVLRLCKGILKLESFPRGKVGVEVVLPKLQLL